MRRLLLATTALTAVLLASPEPAQADPISLVVLAGTAAATATLSATTALLVSVGLSVLGSVAGMLLNKPEKPRLPQMKRELAAADSRPPYRFVYGHNRVYGSPAPWRVKGQKLYGCLILNSRPSAGTNLRIFIDKREAALTGDIFDFSGPGALGQAVEQDEAWGDNDAHFWLGLGDQTGPPAEILSEIPEYIEETDRWEGLTVLWCRFDSGSVNRRQQRWPRVPPDVEVEADWSLVWDPTDEEQDADDPSTWGYSANQALCLLDALRRNPIRRYPLSQIHLESFIEGASIAAEPVERHYQGGTEQRYEAHGVLIWNGNEILDQVEPLAEAGAGSLVRIGSRIGYAPGAWREPIYTITDILEEGGIDFQRLVPGRDLPRAIRAMYIAPDRDWQEAELPLRMVEGAETIVGDDAVQEIKLGFVTSATQAQRIQKIVAERAAAQRRLTCTLPPDAIELVAGANVLGGLPSGFERLNRVWQVESINPSLWLTDVEGGVAMRCPVKLREEAESHYAWDPETDEVEIKQEDFDAARSDVPMPGEIIPTTGAAVALGTQPRIKFAFDPAEREVDGYEWEYSVEDGPYVTGGDLDGETLDDDDRVYGYIAPAEVGKSYDIRVRSYIGALHRTSEWQEVTNVVAEAPSVDLAIPHSGSAVGGAGEITVTFTSPNSADFKGIEIFGMSTDDINAPADFHETAYGAQNLAFEFTQTGLGANETRYYFARSIGTYGARSDFTDSVSATTDP